MRITHLRVAVAIARLEPPASYAKAQSEAAAHLYRIGAAQRHGLFEPFDPDARELNEWLASVRAGRALCREAWDMFMDEGDRRIALTA
ncbi:hypothetical protein [uncultured Algimonas sp.]|uniref:hypothetical protein n=1 Tax=uncultured Algimonas sp. TaxID=1547920 RepID=UPI00260F0037|nr:hypothetical protein [uncultured Algimonas sp.]